MNLFFRRAPVWVEPTRFDVFIADQVALHTRPAAEKIASLMSWGADEHVLCCLAGAWWLYAHTRQSDQRTASNHFLIATLASTALPHLLKRVFDQPRPDRRTVRGHLHGVPFSGSRLDAFPSGHAVHIGTIASAASLLPTAERRAVWTLSGILVSMRVVLLAHWVTDVLAGLAVGVAIERFLRPFTGYAGGQVAADGSPGK